MACVVSAAVKLACGLHLKVSFGAAGAIASQPCVARQCEMVTSCAERAESTVCVIFVAKAVKPTAKHLVIAWFFYVLNLIDHQVAQDVKILAFLLFLCSW